MSRKIKNFGMLYSAFFIYSFVSVFAKMAARQNSFVMTIVYMSVEIILLAIYALIWQQVLKRFPLVVAMSNKGSTIILTLLWSVLVFQEMITVNNVIGGAIIILGICVVSSDD